MSTATQMPDTEFYENIYLKICAYIARLTSDPEDIAEVSQQVLLKIHDNISTLREQDKLTSWLNRIVYTTLMDYYNERKKNKIPDASFVEVAQEEANDNNPVLIACITELLQVLPPDQRDLITAVEIDGVKQTDYAKNHNLNLSTVKSRLQRAKKKIKELVLADCQLQTDKFGNVVDYHIPSKKINK